MVDVMRVYLPCWLRSYLTPSWDCIKCLFPQVVFVGMYRNIHCLVQCVWLSPFLWVSWTGRFPVFALGNPRLSPPFRIICMNCMHIKFFPVHEYVRRRLFFWSPPKGSGDTPSGGLVLIQQVRAGFAEEEERGFASEQWESNAHEDSV